MTEMEREILEELAGQREPRPWGAAVGVCLEFLQESGHAERGQITEKGRKYLKENPR